MPEGEHGTRELCCRQSDFRNHRIGELGLIMFDKVQVPSSTSPFSFGWKRLKLTNPSLNQVSLRRTAVLMSVLSSTRYARSHPPQKQEASVSSFQKHPKHLLFTSSIIFPNFFRRPIKLFPHNSGTLFAIYPTSLKSLASTAFIHLSRVLSDQYG